MLLNISSVFFFFFNDTATTEIYTLSLHDALPICAFIDARSHIIRCQRIVRCETKIQRVLQLVGARQVLAIILRSEEHTSELQSQSNLVCRLLLEKKKKKKYITCN